MSRSAESQPSIAGQRVLVTGAGGFIGPRLVAELAARGAAVTAVCRRDAALAKIGELASVRMMDLTDAGSVPSLFAEARPDCVINLARGRGDRTPAERRRLVAETYGVVTELVECAAAAGSARFVQLGSSTEYGRSATALAESQPLAPETPFGAVKAAASLYCLAAHAAGRINATVLRPFIVYGPGDRANRLIPRAIDAAITGERLRLTRETLRRDWVYVDDVIRGCVLALDGRADGETVNLATGREVDNETVVELVGAALGRPIEIAEEAEPPRPWDAPHWLGSTEKAQRLLGWRAHTTLEEGIRRTVADRVAVRA